VAGALKTFFGALQASAFLTGVSLAFGEENILAEDTAPPKVVIVPTGGPIDNNPGYAAGLDPSVEMIWGIHETVELYCIGFDIDPNALPIDHADAVESLRQKVLSALRDQQAQYTDVISVAHGLAWRPISERWQLMQNAVNRYGRALIITVAIEISVPIATPQEATINSFQLNKTITQGPS
jgi:hypothetical protein